MKKNNYPFCMIKKVRNSDLTLNRALKRPMFIYAVRCYLTVIANQKKSSFSLGGVVLDIAEKLVRERLGIINTVALIFYKNARHISLVCMHGSNDYSFLSSYTNKLKYQKGCTKNELVITLATDMISVNKKDKNCKIIILNNIKIEKMIEYIEDEISNDNKITFFDIFENHLKDTLLAGLDGKNKSQEDIVVQEYAHIFELVKKSKVLHLGK